MNRKELLDKARGLDIPRDQFAVFGSGSMTIRNIRDAGDLDLIVTHEVWDELIGKGYQVKVEDWDSGDATPHHRESIQLQDKIDVWYDVPFLTQTGDELVAEAELIEGLRFMPLARLIEFKLAMGRDKDKADIELIEEYLRVHPES